MESVLKSIIKSLDTPSDVSVFLGILLAILICSLVFYIYLSFIFFSIGKRCKVKSRAALVPLFGPSIIAYRISKMHWWPWLSLAIFIPGLLYVGFVDSNIWVLIISLLSVLFFISYNIIWHSKVFNALKKPIWWAGFVPIPFIYVVVVGLALKKDTNKTKISQSLPSQNMIERADN